MASNPLIDPGVTPSLAIGTEEVAGVQYPYTKLIDATGGSVAPIGIAANPLIVSDASTTVKTVQGINPDGGAVTNPVPIGTKDLITGQIKIPNSIGFLGTQYSLVLAPDLALNFVAYTTSGEQYALSGSTDGTKANARYVRTSTDGNPLVAGNVAHDAVDAGNPVKIGGKATTAVPTAVANNDRVDAYFDTTGHQHTKVDNTVTVSTQKGLGFPEGIAAGDGYLGAEYGVSLVGEDGTTWNAVAVDTAGNMSVVISGQVSTVATAPAPTTTTGNLSALGSVTSTLNGQTAGVIQVSGTYSQTFTWEVSFDAGTNYYGFSAKRIDTETLEVTSGALVNTVRAWEFSCLGATNVRMRCSTFVSGTAAVRISTVYQGVEPSVVATIGGGTLPTVTTVTTVGTVTNITNQGQIVDNAAFVDGTTRLMMSGYIFDETAGTALTENDGAAGRVDSKRAQVHVIEDATTRGQRQQVNANGAALHNNMFANRADTFTVAANGTTVTALTNPVKYFSIQCKGTGAAATAWSIVLEGSLDNVNFTTILTHGTADLDGTVKTLGTPFPALYFRSRCVSITLGAATNIVTTIVGVQ